MDRQKFRLLHATWRQGMNGIKKCAIDFRHIVSGSSSKLVNCNGSLLESRGPLVLDGRPKLQVVTLDNMGRQKSIIA